MARHLRGSILQILVVLAVFSILVVSALGQVSKGSISGSVQDPAGAAVVGAEVKAVSVDTNQSATTVSDNVGLFKLPLLSVGMYRIEVSKAGFRKASVSGVGVTSGVDTGLGNVRLEVGATSETVEVSAATPLIETTQAQITNTFDSTYLDNIPGIQENQGLDNLAILLPGVSMARDLGLSNSNGVGFTVDGLRGRSNDQQIDGQNNNDNSVAGPGIFVGDTEFVNQYQITTNNFGAEYGRNAGSVVNIITKSGTNKYHGSLYGTESNSWLTTLTNQQAEPASSPACPGCWGDGLKKPPHFNDEFSGVTFGGPVIKDKLFFFGGFDNEIISQIAVDSSGNFTPDATGIGQLASCFPGSTSVAALQAFGPYGVTGGGPTILGAAQTKFFDNAPVNNTVDPVTLVPACGYEGGGVTRTLPNGSHQYNLVTRVDFTGSKDSFYARYIAQKLNFFNVDEGQAAQGYPVNVPSFAQGIGVSWTHKITNQMLNELRLNAGRQNVQFGGNTLGSVPLTGGLENALANVAFTDQTLLGFGPATNFPQGRIVNTYQVQDNWSYVRGRHQFKAGVNFTYQRSPNQFLPNTNGEFVYSDWASFAAQAPLETLITLGNPALDFREYDSFYYFGDDWKVTNHLTLNLGLTYSYYGQPANLFHNSDTKQQTGSNPFWDPTLPQSITTFPSIAAPKSSWGPSIGFAYAFGRGGWLLGDNKTVVRGGYRLSYDPPFYNIYLNIASSAPQVLAQTIIPGAALPASPFGPAVRAELASSLTTGVFDPRKFSETQVSPDFKPDRVHSWTFGIQRELGSHAAVEVRYVGNHGQNLFQSVNGNPYVGCGDPGCVNPLTSGAEAPGLADAIAAGVFSSSLLPAGLTPCPAASAPVGVTTAIGRENCNEGKVRNRTNTAYSDYNGLQAEFRTTNLFNQLTMKANYTWSKTTDNASEIFGTFAGGGTVAFSQSPFNFTGAEHGTSGLDFPQTGTFSFNEALPFFKGQHGFVGHALGGWSVAGSYIIQSGQGYTPTEAFAGGALSPYNTYDSSFLGSFNSGLGSARPFVSNPSAPATAIGIYEADACGLFNIADPTACNQMTGAPINPTALLNFTAMNPTGETGAAVPTVQSAQPNQVHYILNANEAQIINGTPYGNASRNSLRDAKTNTANFQVAKLINISERFHMVFHMSMINAFNHPNFNTIDPFLEDAGLVLLGTGFGNPAVQNGGNRVIRFGLRLTF